MLYIHIENGCNGAFRPILLGYSACSRCGKLVLNLEAEVRRGKVKKWYVGDKLNESKEDK